MKLESQLHLGYLMGKSKESVDKDPNRKATYNMNVRIKLFVMVAETKFVVKMSVQHSVKMKMKNK